LIGLSEKLAKKAERKLSVSAEDGATRESCKGVWGKKKKKGGVGKGFSSRKDT